MIAAPTSVSVSGVRQNQDADDQRKEQPRVAKRCDKADLADAHGGNDGVIGHHAERHAAAP